LTCSRKSHRLTPSAIAAVVAIIGEPPDIAGSGEGQMLFQVAWDFIDLSEAGTKRSLQLFSQWQPGPAQFQGFYGFADGVGGFAIVEAASAADLAKTTAPWTPFLKFSVRPILPIQESAQIGVAAAAWRDSR
jgi:hypothetical protein